jgi:hypothetical protein
MRQRIPRALPDTPTIFSDHPFTASCPARNGTKINSGDRWTILVHRSAQFTGERFRSNDLGEPSSEWPWPLSPSVTRTRDRPPSLPGWPPAIPGRGTSQG